MKSLHERLSAIAPFVFFPALIILRKKNKLAYTFICFSIITLSSCYLNFYKTNTKTAIDADMVSRLKLENKYFIIHFSDAVYGLDQVYLAGDTLHGQLIKLPDQHLKYLHPKSENKNTFKKIDRYNVAVEVHIYTNHAFSAADSLYSASVTSFNRADVYEFNEKATKGNHTLSTVGIIVTAVALVGIVVASIAAAASATAIEATTGSCNCPQLYIENNGTYNFTSGLYSGAVYSSMERTDYLPLNTVPFNAKDISFKIANAQHEEQFINKVELLQVHHSAGINVLADKHGNIYSYEKATAPLSASTDDKNDVKNTLAQTDEQYYSFDNVANKNGFSDVRLTFDKPKGADKAKLIIHARNTYWGGLIHKEFINMFGDDFEKWRAKQEKADPKDLEKWQTDQALPLMVYIKTNEGWKFIDYYQLIGNTASRDMIMQIDTKNITSDKIELKLETTYRFWDLDFAGIDYSNNQNFTTTVIEPTEVFKSDSSDEAAILKSNDGQYVHLVNDELILFRYSIPQTGGDNKSSYFLISGGYYHNLEPITGKADYNELIRFKKPAAFDKFSREKYKQAQDVAAVMSNLDKH